MGNTTAEGFERYVNWLVAWMCCIALNLLLEASLYLVDAPLRDTLAVMARWATRAGTLCVFIAIILWVRLRRRSATAAKPVFLDGYVVETIKKAAALSFLLAVILVGTLDAIANDMPMDAEFALKIVGAALTAVFVIAFVIMNAFIPASSS